MTKREELQKQYAEYERKLNELKGVMKPEDETFEIVDFGNGKKEAVYTIETDVLEIVEYENDEPIALVSLSGDEAEKLYHFLGGLYG
jgi:hypothetical protein